MESAAVVAQKRPDPLLLKALYNNQIVDLANQLDYEPLDEHIFHWCITWVSMLECIGL